MSVENIKKCLKLTNTYTANERLRPGFNSPTLAGRAHIFVDYIEEYKGGSVSIVSVENARLVYNGGYLNLACPTVGRYEYIVTEGQVVDRHKKINGLFNSIAGRVDSNNNPMDFPCGWEEHPEMQTRVKEAIYALIELTGT